jgi:carbamate kinase
MTRVVVALGPRATPPQDEPASTAARRASVAEACRALAWIACRHELVVSHDHGLRTGLPDESDGMAGHLVEQELRDRLGDERVVSTLIHRTEVDPADPAFEHPTRFLGPPHFDDDALIASRLHGWVMARDDTWMRRVVPEPRPVRILDRRPITWLLEHDAVVLCAGGGGTPTIRTPPDPAGPGGDRLVAVEAVIDHERAAAVLARDLDADLLVFATDADPADVPPATSTVDAAAQFARETGRSAVIGCLADVEGLLDGTRGTTVTAPPARLPAPALLSARGRSAASGRAAHPGRATG